MHIELKTKNKYKGFNWIWGCILIGLASIIMAAVYQPAEKKYKFEATLNEFVKGDKWINIAKQALSKSDLPSRDVSMIIDSLSAFQNAFILQVNSQLEADKKLEKPKQDSSSKKQ